jgi:hypothetical protein
VDRAADVIVALPSKMRHRLPRGRFPSIAPPTPHEESASAQTGQVTRCIADVVRITGRYCDAIGVTRPSYEQIRRLVHAARERRERRRAAATLLLEVDLRARPPSDLLYVFDDTRRAPGRAGSMPRRRPR